MRPSPALALVREVEALGGRLKLHARGLRVVPPSLLTPDLAARLLARGRDVIRLLRARVESASRPSCSLRCFVDWRTDRLVRLCYERSHAHRDGVLTFEAEELEALLLWTEETGARYLPVRLRNALLEVKARFGGRIDMGTIRDADAAGDAS